MIRLFIFTLSLIITIPVFSQSVITLDDFDLGDNNEVTAESSIAISKGGTREMEKCLLDQTNCTSPEYRSSASFSLDDVVNLGVVKREEVAPVGGKNSTIAATTAPLPSIDMEILFDYNSDTLRPDQYQKLAELATVLSGDKFRSFRIVFLGHTDAKGGQSYNHDLSRRRAKAVADFVSEVGGLPSDRLIANGLGSQSLKDPGNPFGPQNRRVQVLLLPGS